MTTYYRNEDVDAYNTQVENYNAEHVAWQNTADSINTANQIAQDGWQASHDEWEQNPVDEDGTPIPEPEPPTPQDVPAEPQPPAAPTTSYTTRTLTAPEELDTAHGTALIVPPSIVVTSSDGTEHATTQGDFDRGYTEDVAVPWNA